ncbi:MAG: metal ABC transporter substrate-binding protein, partial [Thermoanaerobaculia bacterium]
MSKMSWLCVIALAFASLACSKPTDETESAPKPLSPYAPKPLVVYTVNYPLQYFAERIGGDLVSVVFPAPADEDPAFWSPDPETVVAYQRADLILLNGAGYAKWAERASLPLAKMVDTSAEFHDRYIPLEEGVTHTHGPEGEHAHKGYAFTTWLDPVLAIGQARAVKDALSNAMPDQEELLLENFEKLQADLLVLDAELELAFGALAEEPLVFSHPVYQYLAERYGLDGVSLHWEPDKAPSDKMWRELRDLLADHPANWVLWEDTPLVETSRRLAELGLESVVFDPCANTPTEGDFGTVMLENVSRLETTTTEQ